MQLHDQVALITGATSGIGRISLNRKGNGSTRVAFSPNEVRRVVLTVGNASASFARCYGGATQYSCYGGIPRHDNLRFAVKATVR